MPIPYARQPYQPGSRMADLVLRAGEQEAAAIRDQGERSAQLWAGLGQQFGRTMADVVQAREREPIVRMERENRELQNAALKDEARRKTAERTAMGSALKRGDDGVYRFDRDYLTEHLTAGGLADRLPDVFKGLDAAEQAAADVKTARTKGLAGLAYGAIISGGSPQSVALAINHAVSNGLLSKEEATPYLQAMEKDPNVAKQIATEVASLSPEYAEKLKPAKVSTRQIEVVNPDGSKSVKIVEDTPGQSFDSASPAEKPPEFASERDYYARRAKETGTPQAAVTSRQLAAWKKEYEALNDQPRVVDPEIAELRKDLLRMQVERAGEVKEPNQAQFTAAGYAGRMEQAEPILSKLEKSISGMSLPSFTAQTDSWFAKPTFQSKDVQSYMQAARNFINAVLRRESGAVISPSEFAEARQQYLPVSGDDEQALAQKAANRKYVFETMKRSSGKAYEPPPAPAQKIEAKPEPVTIATPGGTFTFPNQKAADDFKKAAGIKG